MIMRIDRYEIVEEIGRGGMAIVYKAMDTALERYVALKVLHASVSTSSSSARFLREAKVVARLHHPNIASVYDVGESDGQLYIVMELMEGSLATVLSSRSSPLSVDQAVNIARQVASALEYAHQQGIIHRDVKPSNILLTSEGEARLSDFGLARVVETTTIITASGMVLGTPQYMAPEQWMTEVVDHRADIYSLGAVLYEMLTLRPPFDANNPLAILHRVMETNVESIRVHNAAVPPALDKAVLRALAKDLGERYQTASQFATALEKSVQSVSPEEFWREWQDTVMHQLLTKGQVQTHDLIEIPEEFRFYAIERFVQENSSMNFDYITEKPQIALVNSRQVLSILDQWDNLGACLKGADVVARVRRSLGTGSDEDRKIVNCFVDLTKALTDMLNTSMDGNARLEGKFGVGLSLDGVALFEGLNLPPQLPCVFLLHSQLAEADVAQLRSFLVNQVSLSQRVALLLVFEGGNSLERVRSLIHTHMKQVYAYDVVIFGRNELIPIILAKDTSRAFLHLVLRHVDLVSVSPFVVTGPTPDVVFFGRESEIREIVEHSWNTSFAVIGGRRMGKSSLLGRLHRLRLPAAGLPSVYHDCSVTPTYQDFLAAAIRDWRPTSPSNAPPTFADLFESPPIGESYILLLDEADKLVPDDRTCNWRLFNSLRSLVNSGRIQIVLSGERTLREALRDPTSPLFNLANEILLGPLDFHAIEELVTQPMKKLEIVLEDKDALVDRIWTFTSGHPNVVQRLCRRLIERLNEQDARHITLDDVNAVIEDPGFQRDDFLSTYWEAATSLEKVISLLMADNENICTLRTVRQALAERCGLRPKARKVDDALQRLVDLRSILKRTPTGYEFAVQAFPRVVAGTMTLDDMLEILTEEYQEQDE
jgi:serine/threonine protein kinase